MWATRAATYLRISVPFTLRVRSFSSVLKDLKYADSHEWVKVDGISATIGITDHAQDHLGKVIEVNEELNSSPGLINASPYENGWIIKVEMSDKDETNKLMDSDQYSKFCEEEDAKH
ncbi:hypothetical protein CMV_006504 [Castanea mollissima]|uniref:Glycine cleavage system H protein n=1 Tax=Castanea mollissima TaxID=60419 RepID=A0A8J4RGZ0_9ROSI|nr:hypothetical protein CMV_006504 [Castanea mollissima]